MKKRNDYKMGEIVPIYKKRNKRTAEQKTLLKAVYLRWLYVGLIVLVVVAISLLGGGEPSGLSTTIQEPTPVQEPAAVAKDAGKQLSQIAPLPALTESTAPMNIENTEVTATSQLPTTFLQPAEGDWTRGYGYAYDETWQDYRFHAGCDMTLALDSPILAIADGSIVEIRQDINWGTLLEMDLGGGLKAIYAGIVPLSQWQAGDRVSAGEELGKIGDTPPEEAAMAPHLHLELWLNDECQDPVLWLK